MDYTLTVDAPYFDHNEWLNDGRWMVEGWSNGRSSYDATALQGRLKYKSTRLPVSDKVEE